MNGSQMKVKFWLLLPAVYLFLIFLWFVAFVLSMAHGTNPFEFVLYLMYPARFLIEWIPASPRQNFFLLFLLFALVGLIQWVSIGYLIDKLLPYLGKINLGDPS